MPRSNRPRGRGARGGSSPDDDADLSFLSVGWRKTESRRGLEWNVQPIAGARSQKTYVCPGCSQDVTPGTAHVVVWRADGLMGESADLAARRHWHTHCWRIG